MRWWSIDYNWLGWSESWWSWNNFWTGEARKKIRVILRTILSSLQPSLMIENIPFGSWDLGAFKTIRWCPLIFWLKSEHRIVSTVTGNSPPCHVETGDRSSYVVMRWDGMPFFIIILYAPAHDACVGDQSDLYRSDRRRCPSSPQWHAMRSRELERGLALSLLLYIQLYMLVDIYHGSDCIWTASDHNAKIDKWLYRHNMTHV